MRTVASLVVFCLSLTLPLAAVSEISKEEKLRQLQEILRAHKTTLQQEFKKAGISQAETDNLLQGFATEVAPTNPHSQAEEAQWEKLEKLSFPGGGERLLRSTTITTEATQQQGTVSVLQADGTTAPQPNPDGFLWKVSSTTDYSTLVPTTADVYSQASSLHDAGVDISRPGSKAFCSPATLGKTYDFERCVLRSGPKFTSSRVASGFKGTFSFGQNPSIVSGIKVPAFDRLENTTFTGEVDFDPSKLFMTGTDWLNAYQTAALYPNKEEEFARYIASQCPNHVFDPKNRSAANLIERDCIDRLSGPHGWSRFASLVIPTVKYVEKSAFDYIASNGGQLIPNYYPRNRLADVTYSVDLTRFIPSAKARQDAMEAVTKMTANVSKPTPFGKLLIYWKGFPEAMENDNSLFMALMVAAQDL